MSTLMPMNATPEATLKLWLADEEATRQRQRANAQPSMGGVAMPAQLANLSGLAAMQAMLAGKLPLAPIFHTMDFLLVEVAAGHAVYQGEPLVHHLNPMGGVHGGWYATLLDSALGCAVHTLLTPEETYTTLELKVNLVKGLKPGQPQRVRAIGRVRHRGRQTVTGEADLVGPDGKLYAHASTTCLVMPRRD
jgi:uncharacterized protein (TIGR00369 family)